MVQCLGLAFESMAMEVHGNLRESFDTSQGEKMANPVLLIFLSLESRITSHPSCCRRKKDEREKEKKEGRKRFIFLIKKCCGGRGRKEGGREITWTEVKNRNKACFRRMRTFEIATQEEGWSENRLRTENSESIELLWMTFYFPSRHKWMVSDELL